MKAVIKITELRIGNYVIKDGEDCMITHHDLRYISECPFTHDYKPIKLSEQWKLDLSGKKVNSVFDGFVYEFKMGKYTLTLSENNLVYMGCFTRRIKYVHQLQNLIFAMSDKEIKLK